MGIIKKFYELYKIHLADVIFVSIFIVFIYSIQFIPYLNIIIVNFDPVLSSIVGAWIIFYIIATPKTVKIFIWALSIFVFNYIFVAVFYQLKIAELLSSLSFAMLFTAVIVEIVKLRKLLQNAPSDV